MNNLHAVAIVFNDSAILSRAEAVRFSVSRILFKHSSNELYIN